MQIKKWLAAALAACLSIGAACPFAFAEEGGEAEPYVPKIVISGTRVTGGETFELGLRVRQAGLKSVSATLAFDAETLIPASWDAEATPVDLTGAAGWESAKELPAKLAADGMSYKPARAWLSADGKTGYLYLGAANDTPADVDGLTALVRFAYAEGVKPEELKLDGGADSAVRLAPDGTALLNGLFPQKLGYTARGAGENQLTQYVYKPIRPGADGSPEADEDYAHPIADSDVAFSLADAASNVASASADGFCTVVFYDWDGTLLGSRIVAKGGSLKGDHNSPDDRDDDDPNAAPLPPEGNMILDDEGNKTGVVNKAGYTFAGWVRFNEADETPIEKNAQNGLQTIPEDNLVSLSNIVDSLVLQAAYDETEVGSRATQRYYKIEMSEFIQTSAGLETTFTVTRAKTTRRANPDKTYLQVTIRPQGRGETTLMLPLGKTDWEQVSLTLPVNVSTAYEVNNALSYFVVSEIAGQQDNRSGVVNVPRANVVAGK